MFEWILNTSVLNLKKFTKHVIAFSLYNITNSLEEKSEFDT